MTTDYRALCAELLQAWDDLPWEYDWKGNPVGPLAEIDDTPFEHARAALAEPDPVGPMDEPLGDLIDVWVREAFNKKPYGCSHPTHAYVACKAFEYGKNHATHPAISVSELLEPEWVRQEDQTHKTTDHAQLIDGEWWAPYSDLFSMQRILDNARAHAQGETEGGVA
jgi:hypothetical protein